MSSRELSPEWVLSSFIPPIAAPQHEISELIVVARRLWPGVQAHAHREQPGENSDEALDFAFAGKVWTARQYGYSWRYIATQLGLTEPQAKLRFRYAIGKLRARLGGAT